MFRSCLLRIGLIFAGLTGAFPDSILQAQDSEAPVGEIFQINSEPLEGKTRIVLKVRHAVKHKVFSLINPDRVVINLTPCLLKLNHLPEIRTATIRQLRCSQFDEKTVRLVLDLKQKVPYSVSTPEDDLFQIWIDLEEKVTRAGVPEPDQTEKKAVPLARTKEEEAVNKTSRPESEVKGTVASVTPDSTSKGSPPKQLQERNEGKEILQSQLQRAMIPELEGLFTRAKYAEVIRLYHQHREALRDCPEPRLFVLLGKSFKALGLPDLAGRYFQAAWQRGNQEPQDMLLDWAEALIEKGDLASAAPLLRKLIDQPSVTGKTKQRAYLLLGQGWYGQRNYAEGLKVLEESIARYPSLEAYPERWFLLGSLYGESPVLNPKAYEALRKFIVRSQDPAKSALAYERIGDLYFREGKVSEAREAFQQAQQLNRRPASPFLTQKIIQCRLLLGPKGSGSNAANPPGETEPFWTKVYESRVSQQTLEKKISDLRLN
jgi:tetratricopeptide (TPR) repeat protein